MNLRWLGLGILRGLDFEALVLEKGKTVCGACEVDAEAAERLEKVGESDPVLDLVREVLLPVVGVQDVGQGEDDGVVLRVFLVLSAETVEPGLIEDFRSHAELLRFLWKAMLKFLGVLYLR